MTFRFEVIPRQVSVVVFDEQDTLNYCASCNVFIYGDRGFMYTINGEQFYAAFALEGRAIDLLKKLNVRSLEGYVTKAHARLMRMALRKDMNVEITGAGEMMDHSMVWVSVTKK